MLSNVSFFRGGCIWNCDRCDGGFSSSNSSDDNFGDDGGHYGGGGGDDVDDDDQINGLCPAETLVPFVSQVWRIYKVSKISTDSAWLHFLRQMKNA